MTLIVDASALYAGTDANDPNHQVVAALLRTEGPLVTSEAVAAEADHLVLTRLGIDVELQFLDDLAEGALAVECLGRSELRLARDVARQYRDLQLGLGDASLIVLAHRLGTRRVASFDHRCFRMVKPLQGGTFTVLPADG
ncbi:MAG: type II toxin-antitoxin system VapC family toxin [Egibacteraceae bacterium]